MEMKILIWEARTKKGMSIRELSAKAQVPRSTLSRIENGEVLPRMDVMERVAMALELRISDLYESEYK